MPDAGLLAQTACIWEVTARKPGNVTRFQDFADLHYLDFLLSTAAIAPVMARAPGRRPGLTALEAIEATRRVTATNTNLGIVLLLTPLAAVPEGANLRDGLEGVLDRLDVEDARLTYRAIRLASPGGMGRAEEQDLAEEPTLPLRQIMTLAAGRDLIALQYSNGFAEVFDEGVPALERWLGRTGLLEEAIVGAALELLARHPDSLVARKKGADVAAEVSRRAAEVLALGWPEQEAGRLARASLDSWLRQPGCGRNPGSVADLVTACLFVLLRTGRITLPSPYPWNADSHHE